MKHPVYTALFTLLLSACAFTSQDSSVDAKFHPPLTYEDWKIKHYTTSSGIKVCAVSSGYNGLLVTLGQMANGVDVVVASNRRMIPGADLTASVGGKRFVTYDTYFPPQTGRDLVDAMGNNDKAYLEWSENGGSSARERIRVQNILDLTGFKARIKECRDGLANNK